MKVYTVLVEGLPVGRVIVDDNPTADTMQKLNTHISECVPNYINYCRRNKRDENIRLVHLSNETFDSMIEDKKQYRAER